MPDLLLSGAFAHINATMIEWHERLAKQDERRKISRKLQVASALNVLELKTLETLHGANTFFTGWARGPYSDLPQIKTLESG